MKLVPISDITGSTTESLLFEQNLLKYNIWKTLLVNSVNYVLSSEYTEICTFESN